MQKASKNGISSLLKRRNKKDLKLKDVNSSKSDSIDLEVQK